MTEKATPDARMRWVHHEFKGRSDRWCEACFRPDRHPIHSVDAGVQHLIRGFGWDAVYASVKAHESFEWSFPRKSKGEK